MLYYSIFSPPFDSGNAYFHGNWYLRPEEAKHMPTRMFYEQECFQSNIEDTNPMASIMGKCFIMHIKDYVICKYLHCIIGIA